MRKTLAFLLLISASAFCAFAQSQDDAGRVVHDLTGWTAEISAFNYFAIGIGYNLGKYSASGGGFGGFSANAYGLLLRYKTPNEMQLRLFYNMYGRYSGNTLLLGASAVLATNFSETTAGIAPHVGFGIYVMNLFYRYNFHLNGSFNSHEIVLQLYAPRKGFWPIRSP